MTVFGALDHKLVRHCPCPVWLVRNTDLLNGGQIVVALDADIEDPLQHALNLRLIRHAKLLARVFKLELHLLHAWKLDGSGLIQGSIDRSHYLELRNFVKNSAHERVDKLMHSFSLEKGKIGIHVIEGVPSEVVANYCKQNPVATLVPWFTWKFRTFGISNWNHSRKDNE